MLNLAHAQWNPNCDCLWLLIDYGADEDDGGDAGSRFPDSCAGVRAHAGRRSARSHAGPFGFPTLVTTTSQVGASKTLGPTASRHCRCAPSLGSASTRRRSIAHSLPSVPRQNCTSFSRVRKPKNQAYSLASTYLEGVETILHINLCLCSNDLTPNLLHSAVNSYQ